LQAWPRIQKLANHTQEKEEAKGKERYKDDKKGPKTDVLPIDEAYKGYEKYLEKTGRRNSRPSFRRFVGGRSLVEDDSGAPEGSPVGQDGRGPGGSVDGDGEAASHSNPQ
jgi:hypothetical protein